MFRIYEWVKTFVNTENFDLVADGKQTSLNTFLAEFSETVMKSKAGDNAKEVELGDVTISDIFGKNLTQEDATLTAKAVPDADDEDDL